MADYSDEIATARELIEESGEYVTFSQDGETYQEWVTFVPPGGSVGWLSAITGTALPAGLTVGLMPGDAPFTPRQSDTCTRTDGEILSILPGSDRIAPSGVPILYILRLGQ